MLITITWMVFWTGFWADFLRVVEEPTAEIIDFQQWKMDHAA